MLQRVMGQVTSSLQANSLRAPAGSTAMLNGSYHPKTAKNIRYAHNENEKCNTPLAKVISLLSLWCHIKGILHFRLSFITCSMFYSVLIIYCRYRTYYSRIPIILINSHGHPPRYAENGENWIFL